MNTRTIIHFSVYTLLSLFVGGCSSEAWYEGVKRGGENQCRQASPNDAEACMARLNTMNHDEYQRARSAKEQ